MGNKRSLKMEFGWVYLCLSVTLGGCSGQLSTFSEGLVGSTVSGMLLSSSVSPAMLPEGETLTTSNGTSATEGHSTEGPSVENSTSISQTTASSATATPTDPSSTTGVNASSTVPVVVSNTTARTTSKKTSNEDDDIPLPFDYQSLDASFKYDYGSLRRVGLGVAFVLFLTGILVIASSRVARIPKCRSRSGKTYEVTRV